MSSELSSAIQQIAEEKNLSVEAIVETIELALAAAFRKDFGNKLQNIKVDFNLEDATSKVFDVKTVVTDELFAEYVKEQEERKAAAEAGEEIEEVVPEPAPLEEGEEPEPKFNPKTMVSVADAQEIKKGATLDEELRQELDVPEEYGRMAAQTAKQVIIQKIREAEREIVFTTFKEREHELVNGMIQRVESKVILVDVDKATTIMPISEQIPSENYQVGNRLKLYVKEVNQTPKGPEIIVSRSHPEMVRKLFAIEVPEITAGTVVIKSIAREAGSRSKIAVTSKEENIDPIGACVGQRGARVQTIISELGGEKVDIIEYDEDPIIFIGHALAPAKVSRVEINEETKEAKGFVVEDQLSLAIGKGGQNVRLAARLTGWKIDIVEEGGGKVVSSEDSSTGSEQAEETPETSDESTNDQAEEVPTTDAVEKTPTEAVVEVEEVETETTPEETPSEETTDTEEESDKK